MNDFKISLMAFIFTAITALFMGALVIPILKKLKAGQNILGYVDNHAGKAGTTTMGGIIFFIALLLSCVVFVRSFNGYVKIIVAVSFAYLVVGFMDDYIKIRSHKNEGLTALQKLFFQCEIALIVASFCYLRGQTVFFIPFLNKFVNLGIGGFFLIFFVFIATTNCVNLTDGLDGLAGGVSYVFLILFFILIRVQTFVFNSNYILPEECNNIALICLMQAGAIIGFLIYNTFSASVFMGDTGSLYLGAFMACAGIFSGNTLFIPFFGVMFVASGISVILQVAHYKRTGKRLFLMAPLHHHFEYKGHSESKIVFVYKYITLLCGCLSIISVLLNL